MLVTGGHVSIVRSEFVGNRAATAGGAIYATASTLALRDGTVLVRNNATRGHSFFVDTPTAPSGSEAVEGAAAADTNTGETSSPAVGITYTLPAPIGRWLPLLEGQRSHRLPFGALNSDYPYDCPAGSIGKTLEYWSQVSPNCDGRCDPGYFCPNATGAMLICPRGYFCVRGSAAGQVNARQ